MNQRAMNEGARPASTVRRVHGRARSCAAIAAMALAAWSGFGAAPTHAQPPDGTLVELPTTASVLHAFRGRSGLLYLPMTVGHRNFWMMVDTGSNRSLLDSEVCRQIGAAVPGATTAVTGATGSVKSEVFTLPQVQLGPCVIHRFHVAALNWSALRTIDEMPDGRRSSGLLGTDVLGALRVVIDAGADTVRLPAMSELNP
jgi:predicted aspartyl protease